MLSSDRDINLTVRNAKIGYDTKLINEVNLRFREIFGQDLGTFFDTNLYNEGLMPDIDIEKFTKNKELAQLELSKLRDNWESNKAKEQNNSYQDIVSLVKQRRFFKDQGEWNDYVEKTMNTLKDLKLPEEKLKEIRNRYDQANRIYNGYEDEIKSRKNELINGIKYSQLTEVELDLMASNDLYLKYMKEVDQIKIEAENLKEVNKEKYELKMSKYRYKMGLVHHFVNEAGMSEGVLRDVVVNGQIMPGINKE